MIDPQLLKSLGWNDDLINEVNRVARSIETPVHDLHAPDTSTPVLVASSAGTVVHFRDTDPR